MLKRKKKRGSRRIQLDDASAESYVAGLVEAAAGIRMPELFAKPHPGRSSLSRTATASR